MKGKVMSVNHYRQRTVDLRFGFTLVELLVVISIIALLLAILIPVMQKAKLQAHRVICETRIKSVHTATFLYGNDNSGILPQGGYHLNGSDYDDAIGMDIKNFFRIAKYIVQIKGVPTDDSLDAMVQNTPGKVAPFVKAYVESSPGQVFVCPELRNSPTLYYDFYYRKNMTMARVLFSTREYARIGFCYLAGFETEKWDFNQHGALSNPDVQPWVSPRKTSDRGSLVLMTDRVRYVPAGESWVNKDFIEVQHTNRGLLYKEPVGNNFDYTQIKGGTDICTLDGAIKFKSLNALKMRQFFNDSGAGGLNHQDYTFF
jgi:prepilin-type N-terminal cleavage/methylation domain-containing protein